MSARSALPIGLAVCLLAWPAAAPAAPDCVLQWTASGSDPSPPEFTGIAVDPGGRIYVADAGGQRILEFNVDGYPLGSWGGPGTGNGEFQYPSGIAADGRGFVYVADAFNHRIQKFTSNGIFVAAWGGPGTEPGRFRTASGVAVDASGFVYAADLGNHRVQKFTSEGTPVAAWTAGGPVPGETGGGTGGHPGHFRREDLVPNGTRLADALAGLTGPIDLTVDAYGTVYVLDAARLRVERFTTEGTPLRAWDLGPLGVTSPGGIAAGDCGTVVVTDLGSGRVVLATPTGWSLDAWAGYDPPPADTGGGGHRGDHFRRESAGIAAMGANGLDRPEAAAVDAQNRVLVAQPGMLLGFRYPSPVARLASGVYPWHAANVCPTWTADHIPIGVLGQACMPVSQVDLSSLVLAGAGAPVSCRFGDVGRPGGDGACPEHGGDGCCDLMLEFCGGQILDAAGRPAGSGSAEITLTGSRLDGTPLWGVLEVTIERSKSDEGGRRGDHFQRLAYTVPETAPVRIAMYDVRGRFVGRLVDEVQGAGGYELEPGRAGLPAGVYFFRIEIGPRVETRKLVLLP